MAKAPAGHAANEQVLERLEVVERLVKLFRFERMAYLGATVSSVLILLVCVGLMLADPKNRNIGVITALFGSAGLITYSLGRLLRMWDQAIRLLLDEHEPAP